MILKKIFGVLRIFESNAFLLILFILFLAFRLLPYYRSGTVILGGESNYVLDFALHLKKFGFIWFPTYGCGIQNMAPPAVRD